MKTALLISYCQISTGLYRASRSNPPRKMLSILDPVSASVQAWTPMQTREASAVRSSACIVGPSCREWAGRKTFLYLYIFDQHCWGFSFRRYIVYIHFLPYLYIDSLHSLLSAYRALQSEARAGCCINAPVVAR